MTLILHIIFYFFKWLDQKEARQPPQPLSDHRRRPMVFPFSQKTGIRFVQIPGAMV